MQKVPKDRQTKQKHRSSPQWTSCLLVLVIEKFRKVGNNSLDGKKGHSRAKREDYGKILVVGRPRCGEVAVATYPSPLYAINSPTSQSYLSGLWENLPGACREFRVWIQNKWPGLIEQFEDSRKNFNKALAKVIRPAVGGDNLHTFDLVDCYYYCRRSTMARTTSGEPPL